MPTRLGRPAQIAADQLGWASVTKGVLVFAVLLQLYLFLQLQPVRRQLVRNNAFFSTPDTRIRDIAAYVRRISPADNQPGFTLLVSRDDQVLYTAATGSASIELGVKMHVDMRFRLASVTKQFAAVAALMLVEEGALSLQQPIVQIVRGYEVSDARFENITLHHLLTHTSGIPHWAPWMVQSVGMDFSDFESIVRAVMNETLLFQPGSQFAYSSAAYQLLGAVIEKVADVSLETLLQQRVFDKLHMVSTGFDDPARVIPGRVQGYTVMNGRLENANHIINASRRHAAGALISNVQDLLKWDKALFSDKVLLNETSLRQLSDAYTLTNGSKTECSAGFFRSVVDDVPVLSHGGMHYGFTSFIMSTMQPDVYVAVLANSDDTDHIDVNAIAYQLVRYAL